MSQEAIRCSVLTPLVLILEVIAEILIPFMMTKIIDVGIANGDIAYVLKTGALMLIISLASLSFGVIGGRFAAVASTGFAKNLRRRLFYKVQEFSFANVDNFSTASLVTRLTADVTNTQNAYMMVIRTLARAPIMMISATFMAIKINAELSSVFFVAIPVLGITMGIVSTLSFPRFQTMLKKYDAMNTIIQENLTAIRVVKAFVRGKHENGKFEFSADELRKAQRRAENLIVLISPVMQLIMYACILTVVWLGGKSIIRGDMLTGELFSFITYISQILMSLMMISMVFVILTMSRASISRIIEVLDEVPDIDDSAADHSLEPSDGSIEFKNVDFSYSKNSDNLTLTGINLSIKSGEMVGIIGGTGSAKTTLVQLIPRLYDICGGEITVGGRPIKDYSLNNLRNNVAMVLQKNLLFSGTIAENLRWGNPEASQEELEEACKVAAAHEFIMSFPDGYETQLGQGGVNVSGGQKQRLCIARALLKRPKILIMDDSTSAVDTATDSRIRGALKEKLKGTTAIIIAQRITSVMDADKIVVLNDGKIDAVGTHSELLETNAIYREVYDSQQKGGV